MRNFDMTNFLASSSQFNDGAVSLQAPNCPPVTMQVRDLPKNKAGAFNRDTGEITISPVVFTSELVTPKGVVYHEYAHHLQHIHCLQEGETGWGKKLDHPEQTRLFEKHKGRCSRYYASSRPHEMAAEAFAALLVGAREYQEWTWDEEMLGDWIEFFRSQEGFREFFPEDFSWLYQRFICLP